MEEFFLVLHVDGLHVDGFGRIVGSVEFHSSFPEIKAILFVFEVMPTREWGRVAFGPYEEFEVTSPFLHKEGEIVIDLLFVTPQVDVDSLHHADKLVQDGGIESGMDVRFLDLLDKFLLLPLVHGHTATAMVILTEIVRWVGHDKVNGFIGDLFDELICISKVDLVNVDGRPFRLCRWPRR